MNILANGLRRLGFIAVLVILSCFAVAQSDNPASDNSRDYFKQMRESLSHKLKVELKYDDPKHELAKDSIVSEMTVDDDLLQKVSRKYSINVPQLYSNNNEDAFLGFIIKTNENYKREDLRKVGLKREYHMLILACESSEKAKESVIGLLGSHIAYRTMPTGFAVPLFQDSQYHIGDFCGYCQDDYYCFTHANMAVVIFTRFQNLDEIYPVAKVFDEQISAGLIPYDGSPFKPRLVLDTSHIEQPNPSRPLKRKFRLDLRRRARDFGDVLKRLIKKL